MLQRAALSGSNTLSFWIATHCCSCPRGVCALVQDARAVETLHSGCCVGVNTVGKHGHWCCGLQDFFDQYNKTNIVENWTPENIYVNHHVSRYAPGISSRSQVAGVFATHNFPLPQRHVLHFSTSFLAKGMHSSMCPSTHELLQVPSH